MSTNAINHDPGPVVTSLMTLPFGLAVLRCQHGANGALLPCLAVLKLKDWNPPASAEESMTSTP